MIIRKFVPTDLKRVFEIENMSFSQSYGINMFQQLYEMGIGFLVAEKDDYVIGYVMFWIKYENQGHIISIAVFSFIYSQVSFPEDQVSYLYFLINACFRLNLLQTQ